MKKAKSPRLLLVLTIIILVVAVANEFAREPVPEGRAEVLLHGESAARIVAEIADSPEELTRGLMFRESLGADEGMLFIFPVEGLQAFWMKNTLIPLDMIFIAQNGTVVKVHTAVPCKADPCPTYSSGKPAMYVLEVNAGTAETVGLNEGSRVGISYG